MPHNTNYKIKIYRRKKYKEDPEKFISYQKEYKAKTGIDRKSYEKHREKRLAQKKEYYKRKKEKEFRAFLSLKKYERSDSRMEKKRVNQRAYVERKKVINGTIEA